MMTKHLKLRNWVFAKSINFLIPISLQPEGVHLWYFELRLFNLREFIVSNIKGPSLGSKDIKIRQSDFLAKASQKLC